MNTLTADLNRTAEQINTAMGRVYAHMAMAIVTSMLVAAVVGSSASLMAFFFTGWVKWLVIFAPLLAVFGVTMALNANPPPQLATALLHGFAAVMALSLAAVFAVFTLGSVIVAFMGGGVLFAVMSGYGYFTKQSLDSWGRYLLVGLIAVIVTSLINLWLGSSLMQQLISVVAIVSFLGLTAYDTQKIREQLMMPDSGHSQEILGALNLYLDFVNLFVSLLQVFGIKRDE